MKRDTYEMLDRLQSAGIAYNDALAIRRCAMTLHRWSELECGLDGGCIERDEETGKHVVDARVKAGEWPEREAK